jgi:hypothetical protein
MMHLFRKQQQQEEQQVDQEDSNVPRLAHDDDKELHPYISPSRCSEEKT